jgi:hypothetical protein
LLEQLGAICRTEVTWSVGVSPPLDRELPADPAVAVPAPVFPVPAEPALVEPVAPPVAPPPVALEPGLLMPPRSSRPRISTWLFAYLRRSDSLPPSSLNVLDAVMLDDVPLVDPAAPAPDVPLVPEVDEPPPSFAFVNMKPLREAPLPLDAAPLALDPADDPLVPADPAVPVPPPVAPAALDASDDLRQPVTVTC